MEVGQLYSGPDIGNEDETEKSEGKHVEWSIQVKSHTCENVPTNALVECGTRDSCAFELTVVELETDLPIEAVEVRGQPPRPTDPNAQICDDVP